MVSSCTIIPASRGRLGGGIRSGGVAVATLSATACTEELGAEIGMVYLVISAVGRVAVTHRTITIHHFNYLFRISFLYLYYNR